MIYLFHGSDVEKTRAKAFEWIAAARRKEPNLSYLRLAREELSPSALEEAAVANSLFAKRLLVLLDDPFAKSTGEDDASGATSSSLVEEHLDALAASNNAIILLAPKLPATKAKKFVAKAAKVYEFNAPPRSSADERGFNSTLVNALAAKDAKKLWLEIARALRAGDAPEMLHGLLHWKARDLLEKGSRSWEPREARTLSLSLISLLQSSRRAGLDLSESLERFALSI